MTAAHVLGGNMTEADLQRAVTDLAALFRWEWVHHRPARTVRGWAVPVEGPLGQGWPDLILCRGPRLIAAELKAEGKHPTAEQSHVLAVLSAAGAEVYLWRPSDIQAIAEILR